MSLIEMFMYISFDGDLSASENKQNSLDWLNSETGNNYHVTSFNSWVAGRRTTPHNIQSVMRKCVIQYLFGDDVGECLNNFY